MQASAEPPPGQIHHYQSEQSTLGTIVRYVVKRVEERLGVGEEEVEEEDDCGADLYAAGPSHR